MDKIEKIKGMLTLLELNDDQYCYEMTSLAAKINNFLDDRSRLLSGQWISVMYLSLTEGNDNEDFAVNVSNIVKKDANESIGRDVNETVVIKSNNVVEKAKIVFDDSQFALV